MKYLVSIDFHKYADRINKEEFDSVYINSKAEMLIMNQHFIGEDGQPYIERWSIPLEDIKKLEVIPYEDNGQTISSC